jgi:TatD DNase family protein
MFMVDAHCHIDQYPGTLSVAEDAQRKGLVVISMTNLPSQFKKLFSYYARFRTIRLALGLHPMLATQHNKNELSIFQQMLTKTSYVGEVGLDFSPEAKETKKQQIESLRFVLSNINDRPRFISLHTRKAESAVLDLLTEFNISRTVFHWYSGPLSILDKAVQSGHYFSINPAMVVSRKGKQLIERIPKDRLLTETDGPFIKVKNRPAHPSDVKAVLNYLSSSWQWSLEDVHLQIKTNFNQLIQPLKNNLG